MVPFGLPGERVRARIYRNHRNFSEADLVEVLHASPHRIAPPCPLFGVCGGCQYQNLTYAEQLHWKQRHVGELLRHLAKIEFPVNAVIPSPAEYGYRSKITPHFNPPRPADAGERSNAKFQRPGNAVTTEAGRFASSPNPNIRMPFKSRESGRAEPEASLDFPIGFLRQGSRFAIVDVPQCPIATAAINDELARVRATVQEQADRGVYQRGATLLLRHSAEGVTTDYGATITEEVAVADRDEDEASAGAGPTSGGTVRLRFFARDFFQNNPSILPDFTGHVRTQAASAGARFLVDAYCGSGLFALTAARRFEGVVGIEISASAVQWARENAAANHIAHATFRAGEAAAIFADLEFPAAETAVVIDPPRRGCDASFLSQLIAFGPRTIVYVSCDPATQMRDLTVLIPAGYTLTNVQPFDLFPQTRHLECVITLRRL
jgi:23S rRNA (uracil1939-C5)-methyltransferase/tRNA (uracil-5-)-methyltransferase